VNRSVARWAVVATGVAGAVAVAALAVSGGLAAGPPGEGGQGRAAVAVAAQVPAPAPKLASVRPQATRPVTARVPAVPAPTLIATLHAATTYSTRPGGPAAGKLAALDPFGAAQVLAVIGRPNSSGWTQVELPIRPNGSVGWIRTAGVAFSETSYQVLVNVETRQVAVTNAGRLVLTTPAAVGTPSTPTPTGHTYLWELVRPDNPAGAYGPYIFGLAMFSDAYATFNGGDAQIGIHGQDEPASVGHPVSHGCVRLGNDVITRLAALLPLGTPVTIV
jgi:lipoprotein-anchoring transpeptidase ErfK/SrfK